MAIYNEEEEKKGLNEKLRAPRQITSKHYGAADIHCKLNAKQKD